MMLKIGVTQRVETIESYNERRDCLDQQWATLLESIDMLCIPLSNFPALARQYFDELKLDGIILSGGNNLAILDATGGAPERDQFEYKLLEWSITRNVPVLGVCRGLQMINHFCGGSLLIVQGHVATRHPLRQLADNPVWPGLEIANSFHNYAVTENGLGTNLVPLAMAGDKTIEAFKHDKLPWYAVMWHPERESPFNPSDLEFIKYIFRR